MYHSLYMWKSFSEPTPYGPHIGWRGVTSVQGGILADYDQNFSRGRDSPDTKFQLHQRLRNYVPLTLYVEIFFWANALRTPYWLTWYHGRLGRHIGWLRPNWRTSPEVKYYQVWCHVSSGRHIGWLRPKLYSWMGLSWHKVSASSKMGKICTTHFICWNLILSQRLTDHILADVVSRQFRAAYWLITTKLIHMSWSEILPSLVILSLFTFELHVIELFLPNSVLMLYIRQWPSWCNVNSGRHIGWLRPKF